MKLNTLILLLTLFSTTFAFGQLNTQLTPSGVLFNNGNNTNARVLYDGLDMVVQNETDDAIPGWLLLDGKENVRFRIDGSTQMTLDENGNVGIGTTSPSTKVSITPNVAGAKITLFDAGDPNNHAGFGVSSGQLNYHSYLTDDHVFYAGGKNSDGTELMRIQDNGNVGIGTTSPDNKLDVNGEIQLSNTGLPLGLTTEEEGGATPLFNFDVNFRTANTIISSIGAAFRIDTRSTTDTPLFQWLRRSADDNGNGEVLMILDEFGRFALNTTNPEDFTVKIKPYSVFGLGLDLESFDGSDDFELFTNSSSDALEIYYNNGAFAIGNFAGATGAYTATSDKRLKANINSLGDVLDKLLTLDAKTYYYKSDKTQRQDIGFIAQDVEPLFPELVYSNINRIDGQEYLSLNYANFSAVAIKAIQELHSELEAKDELIDELEARLTKIEALLQGQSTSNSSTISNSTTVLTDAKLEQNQPNPFNGSTTVRYFIPNDVKRAELRVTDLTGKVIESVAIQARGEGQTTFDATTLGSGTYQYSLFLDGQLLDTKQMVLTKN